jgi:hypothetical protein
MGVDGTRPEYEILATLALPGCQYRHILKILRLERQAPAATAPVDFAEQAQYQKCPLVVVHVTTAG